jgi:peroxiredoxin
MKLPVLDGKIYKPLKDKGVQVIGINFAEETSVVQAFAREAGLSFPLLVDPQATFSTAVGGEFLPRSLLVDREGKIRKLNSGFDPSHADELVAEVEKLAAEK